LLSEEDVGELLGTTVLSSTATVTGFLLATFSAQSNIATCRLCLECEATGFYILQKQLMEHPRAVDVQVQVAEKFISTRAFDDFVCHAQGRRAGVAVLQPPVKSMIVHRPVHQIIDLCDRLGRTR
jgi:hypothetical protein